MELSQLEQMVHWLDEERKKDKTLIATLQERSEQQALIIEAQARDLDALQRELGQLGADIRRTDDYPAMIEKTHRDLTAAVEELKVTQRREKTESERLRRAEIEALSQELITVDERYRPTLRYPEMLEARAIGEQRLQTQLQQISGSVADLTKRTDDRLQAVVYLEEQRRADTRRVAAVEGDLPLLRKAVDEFNAKLLRLEDGIRKLPARVEEAIQIAKSYDPKIEELRIADFQREQRVRQYLDQAAQVQAEVARLVEQTQKYALLFNQNKQALDALESFRVRLEKRQNEIAEMQRLNEERLKREWEEWQAAFARDWQKRLVTEEDRWRREDLMDQRVTEHLTQLDETSKLYFDELTTLWEELRQLADRWGNLMRDKVLADQEMPAQRLKALRRFAEEKRKDLL
ncbi:MAG: hypothetical protein RBT75_06440 [Anaerolineae bacterium]|jgi:chromosome segregation ATPase|nr:hypothetical protein [Anaerolineae bacterium]